MSMWTDESSGGDGPPDQFATMDDDSDLLAPDELLVPTGAGEEWTPDQGYPDSSLSVRIWVDDDKRLTKVRISNRWRDRARGTSLSSMFDEAFLLANATVGASVPLLGDIAGDGDAAAALSWDSLDAILAESSRLAAEAAALDELPADVVVPNRWVGAPVEACSHNQMVAVRLSLHGRTEKVAFSEQWLRQARVAEVCDAVLEAHRAAYALFVPPAFERGDRQRLADAYARLQNQSMALLAAPPTLQGDHDD
jgi:hypothetical protein